LTVKIEVSLQKNVKLKFTTLVMGASPNPGRYSNIAVRKLKYNHYPVVAMGLREGEIYGVQIEKPFTRFEQIHTVTLYMGPAVLKQYHQYIFDLKPSRVIFNPGTEDPEFQMRLANAGIEVVEACTLIMISSDQYAP
jgi:predicted CoA-binding protein